MRTDKRHELPELVELERIIEDGASQFETRCVCRVNSDGQDFPVYALSLGNADKNVPVVGFFAGIHGLERIGSEVLLVFLRSLLVRLSWDGALHRQLESVRLVFMPLVNPGGMWRGTRANPQGVDLMRNAPLEATDRVPFLFGGHRIGSMLPWYRGRLNSPMEPESQAVCQWVEEELLCSEFSLALDCHSGFGLRDRVWFPNAHTALPIQHLAEIHVLKSLFERTYANHSYIFEPQSHQYLTHGDLWDYLYQRSITRAGRVFLPFTLEMGSWLWVKKNPRQLFSRDGIFNPLIEHRQSRVLRRHLLLLDFLTHAASSFRLWLPTGAVREEHREKALAEWYRGSGR